MYQAHPLAKEFELDNGKDEPSLPTHCQQSQIDAHGKWGGASGSGYRNCKSIVSNCCPAAATSIASSSCSVAAVSRQRLQTAVIFLTILLIKSQCFAHAIQPTLTWSLFAFVSTADNAQGVASLSLSLSIIDLAPWSHDSEQDKQLLAKVVMLGGS